MPRRKPAPVKEDSESEGEVSSASSSSSPALRSGDLVWAKLEGFPWWPAILFETREAMETFHLPWITIKDTEQMPTIGPSEVLCMFLATYKYQTFAKSSPRLRAWGDEASLTCSPSPAAAAAASSSGSAAGSSRAASSRDSDRALKHAIKDAAKLYGVHRGRIELADLEKTSTASTSSTTARLDDWPSIIAGLQGVDLGDDEVLRVVQEAADVAEQSGRSAAARELRRCVDGANGDDAAEDTKMKALRVLEMHSPGDGDALLTDETRRSLLLGSASTSLTTTTPLKMAVQEGWVSPGPVNLDSIDSLGAEVTAEGRIAWDGHSYEDAESFVAAARAAAGGRPSRATQAKRAWDRVVHVASGKPLSHLVFPPDGLPNRDVGVFPRESFAAGSSRKRDAAAAHGRQPTGHRKAKKKVDNPASPQPSSGSHHKKKDANDSSSKPSHRRGATTTTTTTQQTPEKHGSATTTQPLSSSSSPGRKEKRQKKDRAAAQGETVKRPTAQEADDGDSESGDDSPEDDPQDQTPLSPFWLEKSGGGENDTNEEKLGRLMACVWDDGYFTDESVDRQVAVDRPLAEAPKRRGRPRKQNNDEEQTKDEDDRASRRAFLRRRETQARVARLMDNLAGHKLDPHILVGCEAYDDADANNAAGGGASVGASVVGEKEDAPQGEAASSKNNVGADPRGARGVSSSSSADDQPYSLVVHPDAAFLCDLHAHLAEAEIIGLLGGRWDAATKTMHVQAPFPCRATARDDDGATDVEMDPTSELQVREVIKRHQMDVVGWYHSHPRFAAEPSVTDIENQRSYQGLFHDDRSGLAPFVGLIVGTYDQAAAGPRSVFRYFHVAVPPDNLVHVPSAAAAAAADLGSSNNTNTNTTNHNNNNTQQDNNNNGNSNNNGTNNADDAVTTTTATTNGRRSRASKPTRDDVPATRRSKGPSPMIPMALRAKVRAYRPGLDDETREKRRKSSGRQPPPVGSVDLPFCFVRNLRLACTCCPRPPVVAVCPPTTTPTLPPENLAKEAAADDTEKAAAAAAAETEEERQMTNGASPSETVALPEAEAASDACRLVDEAAVVATSPPPPEAPEKAPEKAPEVAFEKATTTPMDVDEPAEPPEKEPPEKEPPKEPPKEPAELEQPLDEVIEGIVASVKDKVFRAKRHGGIDEKILWLRLEHRYASTHLGCVAHTVRQLGHYYSRNDRRVELTMPWRKDVAKWEKLAHSLTLWTLKMAINPDQRIDFLTDICLYMHYCWRAKPKKKNSKNNNHRRSTRQQRD